MPDALHYPRPPRLALYMAAAHLCLSLGGLLLHLRIHPMLESYFHWWAGGFGLMNCLVLPGLFLHPRGVGAAYVLNILTVIAGSLGMAYYSLHTLKPPFGLEAIFLKSTLPDILILWAKLPLGQALLEMMRPHGPRPEGRRGCGDA